MEFGRIGTELKYIQVNGQTLSIDERHRLELGTEQLLKTLGTKGERTLYFWGKIRGKYIRHQFKLVDL